MKNTIIGVYYVYPPVPEIFLKYKSSVKEFLYLSQKLVQEQKETNQACQGPTNFFYLKKERIKGKFQT